MKIKIWTGLILLLCTQACDLEYVDDCNANARFEYSKELEECTAPCTVTFIPKITGLYDNVLWNLGDGSEMTTDATFTHTYEREGNFNVKLTVFSMGCDAQSFDETVEIGVNLPVARIDADPEICTVGSCTVNFSYTPVNATSWIWRILETGETFTDASFSHAFNDRPGIYTVELTAIKSIPGLPDIEDKDTVSILVEPITFDETHNLASGTFERVFCVTELANGNFRIFGNTKTVSYTAGVSRDGKIVSNTKNINGIEPLYLTKNALRCVQVKDRYVVLGDAVRLVSNQENTDGYLVALDDDLELIREETYLHAKDGNEGLFGAAYIPGGGYLLCGKKSDNLEPGMLFIRTDDSFNKKEEFVHFGGNTLNKATGIITLSSGEYMVVGAAVNPQSKVLEGCLFRMDRDFEVINSSINYYGSFMPDHILRINDTEFIIAGTQGGSGVVRRIGDNRWGPQSEGNTTYNQVGFTRAGQLILVGYKESGSDSEAIVQFIDVNSGDPIAPFPNLSDSSSRELFSFFQTMEGGFVLGGETEIAADDEALLIRLKADGNF